MSAPWQTQEATEAQAVAMMIALSAYPNTYATEVRRALPWRWRLSSGGDAAASFPHEAGQELRAAGLIGPEYVGDEIDPRWRLTSFGLFAAGSLRNAGIGYLGRGSTR